jgi:hypothetical protein
MDKSKLSASTKMGIATNFKLQPKDNLGRISGFIISSKPIDNELTALGVRFVPYGNGKYTASFHPEKIEQLTKIDGMVLIEADTMAQTKPIGGNESSSNVDLSKPYTGNTPSTNNPPLKLTPAAKLMSVVVIGLATYGMLKYFKII